jgi:phage N-6-adenine-methyltransferase
MAITWQSHRTEHSHDEWLTPPEIIQALGEFDLDPCAPGVRPWDTARKHYTADDNGLIRQWFGRVWVNPPYGRKTGKWLARLADHGNGIALVFARTETTMFFDHVFPKAKAIHFIEGRITFHNPDGTKGKYNGGGPSCLISYNDFNTAALLTSKIPGRTVFL